MCTYPNICTIQEFICVLILVYNIEIYMCTYPSIQYRSLKVYLYIHTYTIYIHSRGHSLCNMHVLTKQEIMHVLMYSKNRKLCMYSCTKKNRKLCMYSCTKKNTEFTVVFIHVDSLLHTSKFLRSTESDLLNVSFIHLI